MAYTPINASTYQVGKAVKEELISAIVDNLDDHESRIIAVEGVAKKVVIVDELVINAGQYGGTAQIERVAVWRAPQAFNLVTAQLTVFEAGTAGTLEIDLLKGTSLASMVSVFATKPSVAFGAGNNAVSTNALFSTVAVAANDYLKLNITSLQQPQLGFHIFIWGEI